MNFKIIHCHLGKFIMRRLTVLVACLIAAFATSPDRISLATYHGRRGHPMILPGDLAHEVLSWPASRGLNELRREHPDRAVEIEIEDPGVVIDVDTPADLEAARMFMEEAQKREREGSE